MKAKLNFTYFTLTLGLLSINLSLSTAHAQGALTPPGAPAPTMKSLAQIEPRTDVSSLGGDASNLYLITNSGSYYLTANLTGVSGKNGIGISANNVTLDLNGFAVAGGPGVNTGISVQGARTNVVVRNGAVSGWIASGVSANSTTSRNLVFEQLDISGMGGTGMSGNYILFLRCNVRGCGGAGIIVNYGEVRDCTATGNLGIGMSGDHSLIRGCLAEGNNGDGFYITTGTVADCLAENNTSSGIYVDAPGCLITGNQCVGNNPVLSANDAGIFIDDSNNRVENNHVTSSGIFGIHVQSPYTNNVVIRNTVHNNGANNYSGTANNDFGPIGTAATSTSPWANISH